MSPITSLYLSSAICLLDLMLDDSKRQQALHISGFSSDKKDLRNDFM